MTPTPDTIRSLLHTPGEWEYVSKGKGGTHRFSIVNGSQVAFFFGANHSRNPDDEQYALLKEYWQEFVHASRDTSAVVYIEGGVRQLHVDEREAITRDSESGLLVLWAHREGIAAASAEPDARDEIAGLTATFSRDHIAYYYFIRTVHQWLRLPKDKPPYAAYVGGSLQRHEAHRGWEGYDFSLAHMERIHQEVTGNDFMRDLENRDSAYFLNIFVSIRNDSPINAVGAELATIRNVAMVHKVCDAWQSGKSVFAAFGNSHVILQERALRTLLV